jgi:predicted dehydrogenase
MALTALMLGAGNRGFDVYGRWALSHPNELKFVAVADADPSRLERFGAAHDIGPEAQFSDWRAALEDCSADAVFVCLPDALHEDAALACLGANRHVMLEKPVANTLAGTLRVLTAARASRGVVMLGYVLRYTPFFTTLRELIQSGALGDLVTVDWRENVSSIHYAHSYVRGNWRNAAASSPMVLAKCSHDLDLLGWLTGLDVERVSSFGRLSYFTAAHAPDGAPKRCLEGCPVADECAFYAPKIYLTDDTGWPTSTISADLSLEGRIHALHTGPYGRCVYRSDNDVVDHQVAVLEFTGGATATFAMHGHSGEEGRSVRIDGTKATLRGVFSASKQELHLEPHDLRTAFHGGSEVIPIRASPGMAGGGHGGGDAALTQAFVDAVRTDARTDPRAYLESHLLAFALEASRLEGGRVVDLAAFRQAQP